MDGFCCIITFIIMETIYEANEVKLSYKAKQKASERPQILDSKTSYNILLNCFDSDTIELRECYKRVFGKKVRHFFEPYRDLFLCGFN